MEERKPFLRQVAEDIQARFGNDLADIAIVFNNKRPITYLKKHLSEVYGKAIWSPQFFTIQEFVGQSSSSADASALSQFFYLYELHNELLVKEGAEPETLEEFYPIAEIILADFGQLDYELVDIDQIYMELYDTTKIDIAFQHLTEQQQVFIRQFWQSFSIGGHTGIQERFLKLWRRMPLLYRALKEKLKELGQRNYPTLYRNLAEGKAENGRFVERYKKLVFVGFNALSKAEARLFKQWQEEGRALFYFDADAYYMTDTQQEAGLFIRRNVQGIGLQHALGEFSDTIGKRKDTIAVYAASGNISQTKLLHDVLQDCEKEDKTSAILLADESLLVPLLQSLPAVVPNITTGYPLTQSPIFGLIDLWLDVQKDIAHLKRTKVPFQYVETFISHPLTRLDPEERAGLFKDLTDKQLFEVSLEHITIKSSVLPNFFKPVRSAVELLPALVHVLDTLLVAIAAQDRMSQIDSNLLVETKKVLNQLRLGLDKIAATSISFQIGLIRKAIAPVNSAIEGDPLQGLQIMGLLESRCLNFDKVYILGANEGVLPKTSNAATFLPNNLRRAYDLPILENQDALSAYLFYRHFQFSEDIHIFYNGLVNESSSGEESRFVKQLMFESQLQFDIFRQQQPIGFQEPNEPLVIPKEGAVWMQLYDAFITKKKSISATALTTYLQSPLQFFLKHVAEIKEPPTLTQEFEMNKLGTVIHNVMETIFTPYKGTDKFVSTTILSSKLPEVDALVIREISALYQTEFTALTDLNSMQHLMYKIATAYVRMYLQYDMDKYQAFRIVELENDTDYTLEFPIQVNGKEERVKLYGIIDRVDEVLTADGEVITRIVDYKTGGDTVSFKDLEKVFAANTENKALVQTLFYAYVFEEKTGRKGLEPHLYVARKMREEGTLFNGKGMVLTDAYLAEVKTMFVSFLQQTLEEIFDPEVPFQHNPDAVVYPSDPYTLFYR
ncbi:PD-(D/E)XK nuclease family protein [Sphingobacterium psychroaquaticum]|uniref:PD-(D/E)XK nuclease superfamily protein n=1 Tax=Sphingobacterium psychroaquaticum TaxID=561061 RepID=A0A1X7KHT5_9SPHI|nr:PD-(D/E)XK nuclease family protein [Sphingobacterium psychroaquaticum]SMG40784.1 PD-(D/E)XK nuclease superfamily protein [Sphingobacterium psychroaquaticum]